MLFHEIKFGSQKRTLSLRSRGLFVPLETKGLSSSRAIVLRVLSTKILIPANLPVK